MRIRYAHITWKVLEETSLFFGQRLGPNDFTNKGPIIFLTSDLGRFIEDVRRNKLLDSVTIPRQWNNQDTRNNWATHQGKVHGGNMQANGVFTGAVQMPNGLDPYSLPTVNGIRYQKLQGKGWQAPNPEHRHTVFIQFMARFLQKYATPYFSKLLIVGNKAVRDFPKYGANLKGKRYMCIYHILEKCMNPNYVSNVHKKMNWMHSMRQMYAQLSHWVWITFGGMG